MKKKHLYIFIMIFTVAACIGLVKRITYTNATNKVEFMNEFKVATLSYENVVGNIERWRHELPNKNIVLKVQALGQIDYSFKTVIQNVKVLDVFSGENIQIGENIALASTGWRLYFDDKTSDMGFVNFMSKDNEYLIFIDEKINTLSSNDEVYRISEEFLIPPIFNYKNTSHNFVQPIGESSYVPYEKVRGNEFFIATKESLDEIEKFKEELFEMYGY